MKKNFIPNTNRYKVGSDMPEVFRRACTLKTIVARCKKYRCHAILTDTAGFVRGDVEPIRGLASSVTIYTERWKAWNHIKRHNQATLFPGNYHVLVDGPEAGQWAVMTLREAQDNGFLYSIAW